MLIAARESFAAAARRSRMVDVEWLACTATGKEWVDTGFIPSSVTDVLTIDAAYTSAGNTFGCLFGVTSRVNGNQRFYQINKTTTSNQFRLTTSTGDVFWTKTPEFSGSRHRYVLDKNTLYIDGMQTIIGSGTSAESANLYLFARNNRSVSPATIDTYQAEWRVYYVKMERNGVVQFELKPVRIGAVGYFYDTVSGTLLSSGGAPLVVGPDKVLPYDARVANLEFTGSQYVNTGIVPASGMRFTLYFADYSHAAQTSVPWFFGSRTAYQSNGLGTYYSGTAIFCAVGNKQVSAPLDKSLIEGGNRTLTVLSVNHGGVWLDGVQRVVCESATFSSPTAPVFVGAINLNGSSGAGIALRVCRFAHAVYSSAGETLYHDFYPVRVGSLGYLYDVVTGQLCGNAADGGNGFPAACVGPDIN